MTPTKVNNIRVPLPDGTPLTSKITVVRLLSDIGGSSLTYLAKDINGRTLVLKESYPQYTQAPLVREGYKLVFDGDTDELEGFEEEYKNSEILCSEGDTNSIFFFEYRDITDEVLAQDEFSKSAARYMTVATVSGDTLREIHEKNPEIDLKTALTYTRKILFSLDKMHTEKGMLHLDIKDDNLFFPGELETDSTFAILLDLGSAVKESEISKSTVFSLSHGFAAREVQLIKKYAEGRVQNPAAAKKYVSFVNKSTDLYSVGAVMFRLIMHKDFDAGVWGQINGSDDKRERAELLHNEISRRLEKDYGYIVKRLCGVLERVLYFSPVREDVAKNRFGTCTELMREIDILIEILDKRGLHSETVLQKSTEGFERALGYAGVNHSKTPLTSENLFNKDLFTEVEE